MRPSPKRIGPSRACELNHASVWFPRQSRNCRHHEILVNLIESGYDVSKNGQCPHRPWETPLSQPIYLFRSLARVRPDRTDRDTVTEANFTIIARLRLVYTISSVSSCWISNICVFTFVFSGGVRLRDSFGNLILIHDQDVS